MIMALPLSASVHSWSFIRSKQSTSRYIPSNSKLSKLSVIQATKLGETANVSDRKVVRRSANYHPPIWKDEYIQSLKSDYLGETYNVRTIQLIGDVRKMLEKPMDPLEKLEMVDTLQRLGLSYHFEKETKRILESVRDDQSNIAWKKDNLYGTALEFRLLRQHGYRVSQDVFSNFMDEMENFKASLGEDIKGLLNLYEASYLSVEDESILDKAKDFAVKHLKEYNLKQNNDEHLSLLVEHALELPLRWRVQRLEARWFIDMYERQQQINPIVLELAKLYFNRMQAIHQDDLKYASSWWRKIGLAENLNFARDRLMENFLWTVEIAPDPELGDVRRMLVKVNSLLTTIDDVYDVYGTMDELELFTQAVDRWDVAAIELLPPYMKIGFLALYNTINEMAFEILKAHGFDSIPLLKKAWTDQCKSYLLEAQWYYSGYTPTLNEYINNSWISVGAPVMLTHLYLFTNSTKKDCLECFNQFSNLIYCSSVILRLANDLGTSTDELKRGDISKSIQCYMYETGASEEEGREHTRKLIDTFWKKMNGDRIADRYPLYLTFIRIAYNVARISQCVYLYGDGFGIETFDAKDRALSLLVSPIIL